MKRNVPLETFRNARNRITISVGGFNSTHQLTVEEVVKKALHRAGFNVLNYDALINFVSPDDEPEYKERLVVAKEKTSIIVEIK